MQSNRNFHYPPDIFDIFNEVLETNDTYEQNLINNVIERSLNDRASFKKILSEKGEKTLINTTYNPEIHDIKCCPITLIEFKEGDNITKLPCNHMFDSSGMLWWLKNEQASCPVCRTKLDSVEISTNNTSVHTEAGNNEYDNRTNPFFQTNPLTLFSNITIDLSLNNNLREPYNRNYNIESFESLLDSIDEENDDDDLFFFNTLQMMQDQDSFLSNFEGIFANGAIDISNNPQ